MVNVSVIVPNYNHQSYLKKRIDSILEQTYQDFELIILDDCSSDDSQKIIELYRKHPKVTQIVYNEVNSGSTFNQWKKGVLLAKGKYIWIAESDDYASEEFLVSTVSILQKSEGVGLVYTDSHIVENNNIIEEFKVGKNNYYKTDRWSYDYILNGKEELEHSLIETCTINNASAVLFRKDAIELALNNLDKFKLAGDWFTYMQICVFYNIAYICKSMNYYRSHNLNTTKRKGKAYLPMYERILARFLLCRRFNKEGGLAKKIETLNIIESKSYLKGLFNVKSTVILRPSTIFLPLMIVFKNLVKPFNIEKSVTRKH